MFPRHSAYIVVASGMMGGQSPRSPGLYVYHGYVLADIAVWKEGGMEVQMGKERLEEEREREREKIEKKSDTPPFVLERYYCSTIGFWAPADFDIDLIAKEKGCVLRVCLCNIDSYGCYFSLQIEANYEEGVEARYK